jgi:hypothetical protein
MQPSLVSSVCRAFRVARANTFVHRLICGAIGLLLLSAAWSAHANVYATNIRLRGSINPTPSTATVYVYCNAVRDTVQIGYILNEPATAGVTVEILAGTTPVWSRGIPSGDPGTQRGVNTLVWGVTNNAGNIVALGSYAVRITAAADGHFDWTQITDDFSPGSYAYQPASIAVNQNTNSLDYGRVFVGNAELGFNPEFEPGDQLGIRKLNADGSPAFGDFSAGGWVWSGNQVSPWKIEVSDDDYVYVNDWAAGGLVMRFDQSIAFDLRAMVLRQDNRPNGGAANLSGPFITGTGTDTQIWMADVTAEGTGIRRWTVSGDGTVATNDLGVTIVSAGTNSDLSLYPFDLALDRSNRIYTIQNIEAAGDLSSRVLRFPDPAGSVLPLTNADWHIGGGDNTMRGASGIAVDPSGQYVAVAFKGAGTGLARTGGGVRLFSAADGSDILTLTPAPYHHHTDVAWDNVGNLYVLDNWDSVWRAFSPPGPNLATTVAAQTLEVTDPPLAPFLEARGYEGGQFFFALYGRTNINYVIEASTNFHFWEAVATNQVDCDNQVIPVGATTSTRFFRAYTR